MRRSCLILGLALASTAAHADPATSLPDLTAARKEIAADATCVPRKSEAKLRLGVIAGTPTLCAVNDGTDPKLAVGTVACWSVDLAKRRLVPVAPRLLPGETVPAELVKGCTHGLCLPKTEKLPAGVTTEVGINDTGELAMILAFNETRESAMAYVFDRAKQTLLRKHEVSPGTLTVKAVLTRDKVAIMSTPAGPAAEFGIFDTVPAKRSSDDDEGGEGPVDLYEGNFWLVAPGELVLASAGFHHVERMDVANGTSRRLKKTRPSKCLRKRHADPGEDLKCSTHREVSPYTEASLVATGATYLAVLSGARAGELVSLNAKLVEKKLFNAYCKK